MRGEGECRGRGRGRGREREREVEVEYVNVTSTLLQVSALKTYMTEMMVGEGGFEAEFSVSGHDSVRGIALETTNLLG